MERLRLIASLLHGKLIFLNLPEKAFLPKNQFHFQILVLLKKDITLLQRPPRALVLELNPEMFKRVELAPLMILLRMFHLEI